MTFRPLIVRKVFIAWIQIIAQNRFRVFMAFRVLARLASLEPFESARFLWILQCLRAFGALQVLKVLKFRTVLHALWALGCFHNEWTVLWAFTEIAKDAQTPPRE